jgi:hypothetical protein
MGFLDKLKKLFSGGAGGGAPMMDITVRCDRCGEIIEGQINLHNDLSVRYEGDDQFYYVRKGLVGGGETRCFQEVVVEYTFDSQRRMIERRIEGGRFVDDEESS